MSSETRDIRPFNVTTSLERIFSSTKLRFGDQECEPNSRITVEDTVTYGIRKAEIILTEESDFEDFKRTLATGASESGISHSLLSILVTISTSYLKITDIVWQHSLIDLESIPRILSLTEYGRPRALQASTTGATVDVYLVRTETAQPRALHPWRKGTWLAQTRFRIETQKDISLFRPTPLNDDRRAELCLPAGTLRYVQMGDHEPTEPYNSTEAPVFYVDQDLLSELSARSNSRAGKALQSQLVMDFVTAIITSAIGEVKSTNTYRELEESLIGRVVRLIISPRSPDSDRDAIIRMISTDPLKAIAHAEDAIALREVMFDNLRGEEG